MQPIPPLKVFTNKVTNATAKDFGIGVDQLLGTEEVPMAELAWKYVPRNSLVRPEQVLLLSCRCPGNGGTQTCLPAAQGMAPPAAWYGPS